MLKNPAIFILMVLCLAGGSLRGVTPKLETRLDGQSLILSWTNFPGGYVLQSTDELSTNANWTQVNAVPIQDESHLFVEVPVTEEQRFFRLMCDQDLCFLEGKTILQLQAAMDAGEISSERLVQLYLRRIALFDQQGPAINAIVNLNSNAIALARSLDSERALSGPRSELHGIPILLKDSFSTADMPTTAGTLIFQDFVPPNDAFLVARLRDAGAVILGKTTMPEFGAICDGWGWSLLTGQTLNPHRLDQSPGGSSCGSASAVAAYFATASTGSDTAGSLRIPASAQNLVAIKPTMGLVSRNGYMPYNLSRDVLGPISRNVTDAAILLHAMAGYDPQDPVTTNSLGNIPVTYTGSLDPDGLNGARIGVVRFHNPNMTSPEVQAVFDHGLSVMRTAGAEIVTTVDVSLVNSLLQTQASRMLNTIAFEYEMNRYLESAGAAAPVQTVQEIIASNLYPSSYTQCFFADMRGDVDPANDTGYQSVRALDQQVRDALIDAMEVNQLDALVYLTFADRPPRIRQILFPNTFPASWAGLPCITLPGGFIADPLGELPVGIELMGRPFSEETLIKLGYAYEQLTHHRRSPPTTPAVSMLVPIVILQHPQSQLVFQGEEVVLSIDAVGLGELSYQWTFNGVDLPGATNTSYVIASTASAETGSYVVTVRSDAGSVRSAPATVGLLIRPTIIGHIQSQTVTRGDDVSFTLTVTNTATLPIGYRWRRNGQTLTNAVLSEYSSSFSLFNVQPGADEGRYDVIVTNSAFFLPGFRSGPATLTVQE